ADIEQHMLAVASATIKNNQGSIQNDIRLFGQFLTNILVGTARYNRGEQLSGRWFVCTSALRHLLILLEKHLRSERKNLLDNLDPLRRFETVFPSLGRELNDILSLTPPESAKRLLELAQREFKERLEDYPTGAIDAVMRLID